ncbi:preprotein translocase subunit SecE [Erysipelothrix urinaevulpis]|uniref:preprotein translocase subunit SecE n=1 Tax=Erysipelothrix urinaevulpis TaxID=2683717 RepID=UPI00135C9A31|nr:preprotein translocase subunit SecE [Erysipelothrix urinaevulpis]
MKWFTLAGIKEEVRKIHWPDRKEMTSNTTIVLSFVLFFMAYFIITEFVLVAGLKLIGIGG